MAQLLPNGRQQFLDANGNPLAGGLVYFYIPNTTTPKDTWQDAGKSALNTNPVVCDARGQATIYGEGDYRQILQDAAGNQIWDKNTASPISASDAQAGAENFAADTGTANSMAAALDPAPSALTNGMTVRIQAAAANTGPTTLNLNTLGAKAILGSDGTALAGGEIVTGKIVTLVWNAGANSWYLSAVEAGNFPVLASTKGTHAVNQSQVFGVGDSFDVVSRTIGTTYTNSSGKWKFIAALVTSSAAGGYIGILCNGTQADQATGLAAGASAGVSYMIPPGATYEYTGANVASVVMRETQ